MQCGLLRSHAMVYQKSILSKQFILLPLFQSHPSSFSIYYSFSQSFILRSPSLHFPFHLPLVRRHSSDSSRRPRINLPKTTLPPLPTPTPRRIQRFIHPPHPTNLLSLQTRMRSRLSVKPRIRRRNQILCFRGGGRVSSRQKHVFQRSCGRVDGGGGCAASDGHDFCSDAAGAWIAGAEAREEEVVYSGIFVFAAEGVSLADTGR
jgi:hypothetical protein